MVRMSTELTNEEIREKLLSLNYDCGPVTDTTREVHLKKLIAISKKSDGVKRQNLRMTDDELRSKLSSYGETVAPITSANRHIYMKRLEKLSEKSRRVDGPVKEERKPFGDDFYECEPMEID